jgi:hypothetical protein
MRSMFSVALLLLSLGDPNTLTPSEQAEGWKLLFDGKSTDGWLEVTGKPFPAQSWRIEDGCLRAFDPGNGFQDLRTRNEFGKAFEFQFEWKIAQGGNSGVKYIVQKVDDWTNTRGRQARARGFEYQLFDDTADPAHDVRKVTGALYEAVPPMRPAAKPVGEFNLSLLRINGPHVEHWLNGVKVVEFELDSPEARLAVARAMGKVPKPEVRPGNFVSLQNHGSAVWFRGLKVRELAPNENGAN